jgi:hypothetical protein
MKKLKVTRQRRLHPNLLPSERGPLAKVSGKRPVPVLLQQGDIDGACGHYCTWMALLIFGLVRRGWLTDGSERGGRREAAAWKATAKHFFRGIGYRGVTKMLAPYAKHVRCEVSGLAGERVIRFAIAALARDAVVLVGVRNPNRKVDHWVLAVGTHSEKRGRTCRTTELMLLDPDHGPVPGQCWNGTLSVAPLEPDSEERSLTDAVGGTMAVEVVHAVAIESTDSNELDDSKAQ